MKDYSRTTKYNTSSFEYVLFVMKHNASTQGGHIS